MCAVEVDSAFKLFEMPFLLAGRLDWPLNELEANQREIRSTLAQHPRIITRDGAGTLYHVEQRAGGHYAFVSEVARQIEFFICYMEADLSGLGHSATQVVIWNRAGPPGITSDVFFGRLLVDHETILSDDQQTVDAQRFWLRRLVEGVNRALRVGMIDGQALHLFNPGDDFRAWLDARDGWGRTDAHHDRRFFISRRAT